ncbi:MAG: hypothetical protein OSA99_01885 [Acidimicrobiales bacterium]|nr:hypothetical protein [Acidimicrobiales bacterium]
MAGDGILRVAAVAAAACGVFALVTGNVVSAAAAGASSIAVAVLAGRGTARPSNPDAAATPVRREAPPASANPIDLREPEPVRLPAAEVSPAEEPSPATPVPTEPAMAASAQLFDSDYLAATLKGRIAVARRALRPLSVVHLRISSGDGHHDGVPARLIAAAAEATLRESDIVGRRDDGVYVVVLEDTAEDGAVWTTERLRRHIAGTIGPQRFHAGVASYPNHGLEADAVEMSAAIALRAAQEWDRDRIEVALH